MLNVDNQELKVDKSKTDEAVPMDVSSVSMIFRFVLDLFLGWRFLDVGRAITRRTVGGPEPFTLWEIKVIRTIASCIEMNPFPTHQWYYFQDSIARFRSSTVVTGQAHSIETRSLKFMNNWYICVFCTLVRSSLYVITYKLIEEIYWRRHRKIAWWLVVNDKARLSSCWGQKVAVVYVESVMWSDLVLPAFGDWRPLQCLAI